jgi:ABC-2 type transport system ATP-binding protein
MEDLSRSMLQKVAVARALLSRPRLLLLDEPTRHLDAHAKNEVWQIVRELRDLHGITILVAAQEREDTEGLCDRIATLQCGRVVAIDNALTIDRLVNDDRICSQEWPPIFAGQMSNSQVCEEKLTL